MRSERRKVGKSDAETKLSVREMEGVDGRGGAKAMALRRRGASNVRVAKPSRGAEVARLRRAAQAGEAARRFYR